MIPHLAMFLSQHEVCERFCGRVLHRKRLNFRTFHKLNMWNSGEAEKSALSSSREMGAPHSVSHVTILLVIIRGPVAVQLSKETARSPV